MAAEHLQSDLDFQNSAPVIDGYSVWRKQGDDALKAIGRRLGLPLGRRVQVWLTGEIRVEGVLLLTDSCWFPETIDPNALEFIVDNVPFKRAEMTSCVRLD